VIIQTNLITKRIQELRIKMQRLKRIRHIKKWLWTQSTVILNLKWVVNKTKVVPPWVLILMVLKIL